MFGKLGITVMLAAFLAVMFPVAHWVTGKPVMGPFYDIRYAQDFLSMLIPALVLVFMLAKVDRPRVQTPWFWLGSISAIVLVLANTELFWMVLSKGAFGNESIKVFLMSSIDFVKAVAALILLVALPVTLLLSDKEGEI